MTNVTKPAWLQKAEQEHGPQEICQFRFNTEETKTHHDVHCVLPLRLVPLLEEYLSEHRPHLIRGTDPGTLFVGERGEAMTTSMLHNLVCRLTLKHGGKAINPHMLRDIFAYM